MLEIVYAENSKQFLWENSEQFYLIQKTNFMNAVSRFEYTVNIMCREQVLLMWKQILSMQKNKFDYCEIQTWKKHSDLVFRFRKNDFIRCFMRK